MANIYNIQQELFDIFSQIEDNDGELTPELEQALTIKEEEFKDKVKDYISVIKQLELDLVGIKEEKSRLDNLKKSKEKTIERLKQVIVEAVKLFGDTSKTGTKFLDYSTGKVSIRKSESIELDDEGLNNFVNRFINYFKFIHYSNTFDQTDFNIEEITNYCNNISEDDYNEENAITNFNIEDMYKIQANFDFKVSLDDMISTEKGRNLMRCLLEYNSDLKAKPNIDKKFIKEEIKSTNECPTFAKFITKESIMIK